MLKSAEQLFDLFLAAKSQEDVLNLFDDIKSQIIEQSYISSSSINLYYNLKKHIKSWRAQSIWKILDERVQHKVYDDNRICKGKRFLVIGAGPIGLRMAVECAFLGAETHVIEKRTSATRNNILHLWPFTIDDLRRLGAKKFYGQFCAGAIDHISIRQLQLILLKVCCLLGVNVHVGVDFIGVEEPAVDRKGECSGWGINVSPHPPALPKWRWEVMVQASGRQHVLPLFQYKECRGQQAIGMTVNFVNRGTMEELTIEEISGIAFIYNQEFFNDMYVELGIALENIVYYKDETHYFVMSTKKHSLISKHVLKKDYPTTSELLSPDNIDYVKAQQFAREVAGFATNLPVLDFMTNHHGKADVAIFDFSAIKIAANSAMVVERRGEKLLMCLAGDSLLEPFWPQGTGCARGFLSVLNSAWMFKKYFQGVHVYEVLRERESLFKLLAQSSPMKLNNKHDKYTIDPSTRYNYWTVSTEQFEVFHLYNKGDTPIQNNHPRGAVEKTEIKGKRRSRQDRRKTVQVTLNRSQNKQPDIQLPPTPTLEQGLLLNWARESTCGYTGVRVSNLTTAWKSGLAFSALIHRYRPDILNFTSVSKNRPEQILTTVFSVTLKELGLTSPLTAKELANSSIPDRQKIISYLTALYNHFNSEESKSLQISPDMCYYCSRHITPDQLTSSHGIKFHSSCLKCEYCLDKISLNTLHFVNNKIADEFAKRRKPGYQFLKSGFYCKFHFKEFFTAGSSSLYPENWLSDKETDIISETASEPLSHPTINLSTDPLTTHHSDTEDGTIILRENSNELRRAKSVASVRNLRELFENISTGTGQPEAEDQIPQVLPNSIYDKIMNIHSNLTGIPKSRSFSGLPPSSRDNHSNVEPEVVENAAASFSPQTKRKFKSTAEVQIEQSSAIHPIQYSESASGANGGISSKFSINLNNLKYDEALKRSPNAKKKKSGIAKRIEKRRESVQKVEATPSTITSRASFDLGDLRHRGPCHGEKSQPQEHDSNLHEPITEQPQKPSPNVSIQITNKKKNKFKFFRKKSPLSRTNSLVLEHAEQANLNETTSLVITNASDPLYTIPKPDFVESDVTDDDINSSFKRNSFTRRTAPPKMKSPVASDVEDLVDSTLCRRPSKVVQNLSREAVVLKTNSPQARSLLRSSVRNSKRGMQPSPLQVKQNNRDDDRPASPSTPKTSRILIARANPQQAFISPVKPPDLLEGLVSKTICSPKPKRAQKVKVDNVEVVTEPPPQKTSEIGIVHQTLCSPKPQRSKKVRLSRTSPRLSALSSMSSSSESDSPPERPEPPKDIVFDISLAGKTTSSSNGTSPDTESPPARPAPPVEYSISQKVVLSQKLSRPERVILHAARPPQSTTSLTSTSSSSTFTTSLTDMTASLDSPGQVRGSIAPPTCNSSTTTSTDASTGDGVFLEKRMPYLLKYDEEKDSLATTSLELTDNSFSSSDMSEIRSDSLSPLTKANPPKPFMYAKRSPVDSKLKRSAATPSPDPSEYHTPQSHKSTPCSNKSTPKEEKFYSPNQATAENRKYSLPNTGTSGPPEKPPRRSHSSVSRLEPTKERRVEKVLERQMTPAEHSSINTILQKYRKLPNSSSTDHDTSTSTSKIRHAKPSTSVSERRANYDKISDDRPSLRELPDKRRNNGPQNRVKMISQLSASFDKTIDKLVNKYHPAKKVPSPTCTRKDDSLRAVSNVPYAGSSDSTLKKRISSVRKQISSDKKDFPARVKTPSPNAAESKVLSSTKRDINNEPGTRYSAAKSASVKESGTTIPKERKPLSEKRRTDSTRSSTRSRDIIPIDHTLLRYDRNSSFKDQNFEFSQHHLSTSSAGQTRPSRGTEQQHNTSSRATERQTSTPSRVTQSRTNVDKYKYTGQDLSRRVERQQNLPAPTSRSERHSTGRAVDSRENNEHINIGYIESCVGDGKQRDKKDYNRYLKSLYYQYSSPQNVSDKVENTIKVFQRKQTDV